MKKPRPTHQAIRGRFQHTLWGSFTWLHEPRDTARGRLSVAVTRFNPGAYQAPHLHPSEEQLIYVISGSGTSVYDGRETTLAPGVITYMHADGVHEVRASPEGLEMLMVYVPAHLFAGPANLGPDRAVPWSRLYTTAEGTRALANLIETAARHKGLDLSVAAQTLSAGAPVDSGTDSTPTTDAAIHNRHVSAVVSLLHEDPDRHVSLREAAQSVGLNPSHLSRLFRKVMGISFVRYSVFIKMARAKALLATTDLTVKEIADRLGFSSPTYFGQAFRRFEGMTPRTYRGTSKNLE